MKYTLVLRSCCNLQLIRGFCRKWGCIRKSPNWPFLPQSDKLPVCDTLATVQFEAFHHTRSARGNCNPIKLATSKHLGDFLSYKNK